MTCLTILVGQVFFLASCTNKKKQVDFADSVIYMEQPAQAWVECFPLGNGRIGMMPNGGVVHETITLNEQSLWSGSIQNADNPSAYVHLDSIRHLIFKNHHKEAELLMNRTFVCGGQGSAYGGGHNAPYGSYQMFANVHIEFPTLAKKKVHSYRRSLNMTQGEVVTSFETSDASFQRTYYTSCVDDIGIAHYTKKSQSGKDTLAFVLQLTRPERKHIQVSGNHLIISGALNDGYNHDGMHYLGEVLVRLPNGGHVSQLDSNRIEVRALKEAYVLVGLQTSYKTPVNELQSKVANQLSLSDTLLLSSKSRHNKVFSSKMNRLHLRFDNNELANSDCVHQPLNKRLQACQKDEDPNLMATYLDFGRYLLLSCSKPGGLPANLQGLWCDGVQTPWNGDYHLNINLQMNYWGVDLANLSESHDPFFDWVASQVQSGEHTAQVFYHARGWVTHVLGNLWQFTAPGEHPSWGASNASAAWLCDQLYQHYLYTQDTEYLKKLYPIMRGASLFFTDVMITDPRNGYLVNVPSVSPENSFIKEDGSECSLASGTTMDNQIISALFQDLLDAAKILNKNDDVLDKVAKQLQRIRPTEIGADGRIMEWAFPYQEKDLHHRHVSHLYGLYPGHSIQMDSTPQLAEAARKTLVCRGDESTGWSMAWKINFWNRLHDGNHAYKLLKDLLFPLPADGQRGGTYPNLFCAHPPYQIDGNLGAIPGIIGLFIQSEDPISEQFESTYPAYYLDILPACPTALRSGELSGVKVRGGAIVDIVWKNGVCQKITLHASQKYSTIIRVNGNNIPVHMNEQTSKTISL